MKSIINSVFMKLLLVLLVTGISINLLVNGLIQHVLRKTELATIDKRVIHHLDYIIDDLGHPPALDRAKTISEQSAIEIRYESPTLNWSTSPLLSLPPQLELHAWEGHSEIQIGRYRGDRYLALDQAPGRFIFQLGHGVRWEGVNMEAVTFLVVPLTAILAAAYLMIRWILSPIRGLTVGVREVSKGNLDHRVPIGRSDELGDLAKAFNGMTDRLRNMLRAKEQLLRDVSHELRSPLTRMKVALESLSESHAKKSIGEDVAEMGKMVAEVLKIARSHYTHAQLNLRRTNMADLLKGVLSTFKGRLPNIQTGEMPDHVELDLDPDRVKTVLKNVLENAVKYSFNSSKPVEVSVEKQKPYLVIRIRDNGVGISEDELPYIFEPFYRVDKSRSKETGGYGLGLSLCKTVMEAHQGKIEVDSSPDRGTTVSLFFLLNSHEQS